MAEKKRYVDLSTEEQHLLKTQFEEGVPSFDGHETRTANSRSIQLDGRVWQYKMQMPIIQLVNIDTTQNLNASTTMTKVNLGGLVQRFGSPNSDFTHASSVITCNFDGSVSMNVHVRGNAQANATGNRILLNGSFFVNGTALGPSAISYIRAGGESDTEGSLSISNFILSVSQGDTIEFRTARSGTQTSSVLMVSQQSFMNIERIF